MEKLMQYALLFLGGVAVLGAVLAARAGNIPLLVVCAIAAVLFLARGRRGYWDG